MGCNASKVGPDDWASYEQDGVFAWANLRTGELTYKPHTSTWHVDRDGTWTNRWTGQTFPQADNFKDVPVAMAAEVGTA